MKTALIVVPTLPGAITSPVTGGSSYTIWLLNQDPAPQSFTVDGAIE